MHQYNRLLLFLMIGAMLSGWSSSVWAGDFQGGGGSIYLGVGSPQEIDAVNRLSNSLSISEKTGHLMLGAQGFYQGAQFRLGAAFQMHAWAGVNPGEDDAKNDDTAGVAAVVWGVYGTYTVRHDRWLFNVGGIVGSGRVVLGYNLGEDRGDLQDSASVNAFYLEPLISFGVATCRWFGVEAQLSAPLFFYSDPLELSYRGEVYKVESKDMNGVLLSLKLVFGKIAEL